MVTLSRRALTASGLSFLLGACAADRTATVAPITAAPAPLRRPQFGAFGVALENRDLAIKPGDDFNRYCSGHWFQTTQIPADRSSWGSGSILAEQVNADVKALVQEIAAAGGAPGTNEQKIADFYNAFVDVDTINAKGLAPAQADLDAIAALRTHAEVFAFASKPGVTVDFPISMYPAIDARDPDKYCLTITHAGLG
ncbi:MAG TPA: M13 family metallopeptidase N-terminal domain-containing protein, partial [Caulobacterales bacterium]|nr:M13 family metallopeptidase N-terminal domain-containing protein [Caulobacterales bacterium]